MNNKTDENKKEYLGDAVYAQMDGGNLLITTEDGVGVLSRIWINDEVFAALSSYYRKVKGE